MSFPKSHTLEFVPPGFSIIVGNTVDNVDVTVVVVVSYALLRKNNDVAVLVDCDYCWYSVRITPLFIGVRLKNGVSFVRIGVSRV